MKDKASFSQDEIYRLSKKLSLKSESGFDMEAEPYILATDFPFLIWHKFPWQGKKVLIIANSGDNILNLWSLGVKEIWAVDIARKACFINELKKAAIKYLSFKSFRTLFAPYYQNSLFPSVTPFEKKSIYLKLRPYLSSVAKDWFDKNVDENNFLSPNQRELTFAHLIPHFIDERSFLKAKKAIKPYYLFNLSIETALEEFNEYFDMIYLSNIPEYIKQNLLTQDREDEIEAILEELYIKALKRLNIDGLLLIYCFGNVEKMPNLIMHEKKISEKLKINLKIFSFSFSTPLIKGSHFTHALIIFKNKKFFT